MAVGLGGQAVTQEVLEVLEEEEVKILLEQELLAKDFQDKLVPLQMVAVAALEKQVAQTEEDKAETV
jgi:hypothetical protein